MATLIKQPEFLDLATGPHIWSLGNIGTAERFVLQIEIAGNIVATIRQTPNEAGVAHFDIQEELRQNLSEINIETTVQATGAEGSALRYRVRYGVEEAGTQIFTAFSDFKVVLNGYKAWNEIDWTNRLDYAAAFSEVLCIDNTPIRSISTTSFLTNSPVTTLRSSDWYTLSLLNQHRAPLTTDINATPWAVQILLYEDGTLLDEVVYTLKDPLIGPRTTCTSTALPLLDVDQVVHVGVGPQNLRGLNPSVDVDNADQIVVNIRAYNACVQPGIVDCDDPDEIKLYLGATWATREFKISDPCTKFTPIQLAFQNQLGATDYYTFIRRNERVDGINRTTYLRDPGSWNSATFTIGSSERGSTVISTGVTSEIEVSTDWVDDTTSLWFRELFLSPHIKAYYNGEWVPVVGLTQTYEEKSEARNNKLYRYDLRLQIANNIRVQR